MNKKTKISILIFFVLLNNNFAKEKKKDIDINKLNHSEQVYFWAQKYRKQYNIPEKIIFGVLKQETNWSRNNPKYKANQVGDDGTSLGPAQVKIPTASAIWNKKVEKNKLKNNISFNIETACKILKDEFNYFKFESENKEKVWLHVLSSYNLGRPTYLNVKKSKPTNYSYKAFFGKDWKKNKNRLSK